MTPIRKTLATRAVVNVLLRDRTAEIHAFGICKATGLATGVVVPILRRLEAHGWLTSWRETPEAAHPLGRRPRRYYRLTEAGLCDLGRWEPIEPGTVPL